MSKIEKHYCIQEISFYQNVKCTCKHSYEQLGGHHSYYNNKSLFPPGEVNYLDQRINPRHYVWSKISFQKANLDIANGVKYYTCIMQTTPSKLATSIGIEN